MYTGRHLLRFLSLFSYVNIQRFQNYIKTFNRIYFETKLAINNQGEAVIVESNGEEKYTLLEIYKDISEGQVELGLTKLAKDEFKLSIHMLQDLERAASWIPDIWFAYLLCKHVKFSQRSTLHADKSVFIVKRISPNELSICKRRSEHCDKNKKVNKFPFDNEITCPLPKEINDTSCFFFEKCETDSVQQLYENETCYSIEFNIEGLIYHLVYNQAGVIKDNSIRINIPFQLQRLTKIDANNQFSPKFLPINPYDYQPQELSFTENIFMNKVPERVLPPVSAIPLQPPSTKPSTNANNTYGVIMHYMSSLFKNTSYYLKCMFSYLSNLIKDEIPLSIVFFICLIIFIIYFTLIVVLPGTYMLDVYKKDLGWYNLQI